MMKSNYTWVIDAGHGGIKNGAYTTAPAKQWKFPDGLTIFEGVINRDIAKLVWTKLVELGIEFKLVYDEHEDDGLALRVARADAIYEKDKRAIFLSIHSNAGGGSGFEVFTSPGQSKSDKIANILCEMYQKHFPDFHLRCDKSDGDGDKEADYYVLRKTDCPAVLVENLFFDNRREAEFLLSHEGQNRIADCIVSSIQAVEQLRPI
jgi:N-acetylmuramoyl-L-alanine amidase